MKNVTQPSFITFVIGAILVFIGIGLRANSSEAGSFLFYGGFLLMGVFWIWSIIKVISAPDMRPFQKRFWMIAVIAVPVLGGLLFHIMHQKAGKIIS
jgi:hypothetical protein